jgi:CBS domain-containing protein
MPTKPSKTVTISDLMRRQVITIPEETSLREAAHLLFRTQISGAPVVDAAGCCVGVLSASDFVHWAAEGGHGLDDSGLPVCPYQLKGRLLTGEEAMICKLAEGSCAWQEMRPTTGGRHAAVCCIPDDVRSDRQRAGKDFPVSGLRRYMTTDVVTAGPETPLSELARVMIDAHIHCVIVVDEERKPIGVVSSTDLLATLAYTPAQAHQDVSESEQKEKAVTSASTYPRGVSYGHDTAGLPCSNRRQQLIEWRAYEKWKEKGSPNGTALEDWLEAEREVDRELRIERSPYLCRTQVPAESVPH